MLILNDHFVQDHTSLHDHPKHFYPKIKPILAHSQIGVAKS